MSCSRLVLSSPFDAPQRPRTAASRQHGDRKRVKEGGSSLSASNIMVDSRVVRRSTFNANATENNVNSSPGSNKCAEEQQPPGCILFDSRLIKGDHLFANPIITVMGGEQQHETDRRRIKGSSACGHCRKISTPPPVKGRRHISVQTDDDCDATDKISTCAQQQDLIIICAVEGEDRASSPEPEITDSIIGPTADVKKPRKSKNIGL